MAIERTHEPIRHFFHPFVVIDMFKEEEFIVPDFAFAISCPVTLTASEKVHYFRVQCQSAAHFPHYVLQTLAPSFFTLAF